MKVAFLFFYLAAGSVHLDPSLPVLARVAALLPLLTQEEKLHQLLRAGAWDNTRSP